MVQVTDGFLSGVVASKDKNHGKYKTMLVSSVLLGFEEEEETW